MNTSTMALGGLNLSQIAQRLKSPTARMVLGALATSSEAPGSAQPSGDGGGGSPAMSSADKAALLSGDGYGEGMTGKETAEFDAAVPGEKKFGLADLQRMQAQTPRQQEANLRAVEYDAPDMQAYMGTTVASSRELKTPRAGMGLGDALARGISGEDPVDSNGVEVAAIKELDQRLDRMLERIKKLKGVRQ